MRRRLLTITFAMLTVVIGVTLVLGYGLRRAQADLAALWSRNDALYGAVRTITIQAGGQETIVAGSIRAIHEQADRIGGLVADESVQRILADIRLLLAELTAGGSPEAAARLRGSVDRLWVRLAELNAREVTDFAVSQQRLAERLLLVIVAAAAAGCALVVYYVLHVARLLDDFIDATSRLSRGLWTHRVVPPPARELRELAESFNHMAEQLATADARRTEAAQEMLVTLSHEVGNAMASISGLVQLLRRRPSDLPPPVDAALGKIEAAHARIAFTLDRLRDFPNLPVAEYPGGLKMFTVGEPAGASATKAPAAEPAAGPAGGSRRES